jgi:hypothetical protein
MATIEREPRVATPAPRPAAPAPRPPVVTRAELVECACPEACERDHEQD